MKSYNVTSHVHSNTNVRNLDIENDRDFGNSVTQVREKNATQASKLNRVLSIFNQKKKELSRRLRLQNAKIKTFPAHVKQILNHYWRPFLLNRRRKALAMVLQIGILV